MQIINKSQKAPSDPPTLSISACPWGNPKLNDREAIEELPGGNWGTLAGIITAVTRAVEEVCHD